MIELPPIPQSESLASLEVNWEQKMKRPRMGMVADMVEKERRWERSEEVLT